MHVNHSKRRRTFKQLREMIRQKESGGIRQPQNSPVGNRKFRRSPAGRTIMDLIKSLPVVDDKIDAHVL